MLSGGRGALPAKEADLTMAAQGLSTALRAKAPAVAALTKA